MGRGGAAIRAFALMVALLAGGAAARAHGPAPVTAQTLAAHLAQFAADPSSAPVYFPKWESAIRRFYRDSQDSGYAGFVAKWDAFLHTLQALPAAEQMSRVHRYVNEVGYRPDPPGRSSGDYWKSPAEFFASGGDCEDYAIAKYWSLRKLGFAAADLRILVLYAAREHAAHAVLRVRIGERFFLLDNLARSVLPLAEVRDYTAVYGLNETHVWLFRDGRQLDRDTTFVTVTPGDGGAPPLER